MKLFLNILLALLLLQSCSPSPVNISGTYIHESNNPVINMHSGDTLGYATIRDSIFIKSVQNGFEVSNRKWKNNTINSAGWVNQEHAENRPFVTIIARLQSTKLYTNSEVVATFQDDFNTLLLCNKAYRRL